MDYRQQIDKVFAQGTPAQRKGLLRSWVEGITLAPERLEVEITYRVPATTETTPTAERMKRLTARTERAT